MRVMKILKIQWMCLKKIRFEQLFSFKYSARPHTEAAEFDNQIDNALSR